MVMNSSCFIFFPAARFRGFGFDTNVVVDYCAGIVIEIKYK